MKAFIQKTDGDWMNVNAFVAAKGLHLFGYDIIPFELKDPTDLSAPEGLELGDIVFGGIPIVQDAFRKLGYNVPPVVNIPDSLLEFTKREIWEEDISVIRRRFNEENAEPIFIKPLTEEKSFTGCLVKSFLDLLNFAHIEAGETVLASEPINLISEWRCFYLEGKIIDCRCYKGNSLIFPTKFVIEEMLEKYEDRFVAGSIDVGCTDKFYVHGHMNNHLFHNTVLVEVNDAYSLGGYGINEYKYAKMLIARWSQIQNEVR
jgi:hypothetical protein